MPSLRKEKGPLAIYVEGAVANSLNRISWNIRTSLVRDDGSHSSLPLSIYCFQEKENVTDCKEDIKALTLQIQNLVTKVSEMQNDLKKKDDKIKSLKKMVKKNSADSKGKIYQSVQVLV